jgi:hypothetical protein
MTVVSVVGLQYGGQVYTNDNKLLLFSATDAVNLALGLPLLLGSMWFTYCGQLIGLLCWPGALYYVLYTYIPYLIAVPFNVLFLPYLVLVTLSAYTIISLITNIDSQVVRHKLKGNTPAKTAGGILASIALLFILVQVGAIVTKLINKSPVTTLEQAQWIVDLVLGGPSLLMGGYYLFRHKAFGYVIGTGLLLVSSMLFIGIIPIMIYQAISTSSSVDVVGIILVLIIGMVCFIPLGLFLKGTISKDS